MAQATHWENERVDKGETLNHAIKDLNEFASRLNETKEVEKNMRAKLDQDRHEAHESKDELETANENFMNSVSKSLQATI